MIFLTEIFEPSSVLEALRPSILTWQHRDKPFAYSKSIPLKLPDRVNLSVCHRVVAVSEENLKQFAKYSWESAIFKEVCIVFRRFFEAFRENFSKTVFIKFQKFHFDSKVPNLTKKPNFPVSIF